MARLARVEQFSPDEIAIVHVINRAVRRCFLMGYDEFSQKDYNYRKAWIENRIKRLAACFGIDVLAFAILSNHVHLILRQRPDVVATWDNTEVARRWLMLRAKKFGPEGKLCEPTEAELNGIRHDPDKVREIRSRLSDISWWMRMMCQPIAQRINHEDGATGRVWQDRYRAIRILDEATLLACAAYVDLNPIRAAMAETLEGSQYTSVQKRIRAIVPQRECSGDSQLNEQVGGAPFDTPPSIDSQDSSTLEPNADDNFLSPIPMDERYDAMKVLPNQSGNRCSDLGFLNMTTLEYIELLDWTARQIAPGKGGKTPQDAPPIFERLKLGISAATWSEMVSNFGRLFKLVAGRPQAVDSHRSRRRHRRFAMSQSARQLLTV